MRESETREVLLDKLIGIQDLEAIKPIHDMDTDLITECTECIIELTGDELPSESALEQMKQRLLHRLFSRNTRRKGLARKLLIAAIIVILIVAVSVSMMPLGTNDESLISRWGYFLLHQTPGQRKDFGEYLTITREGQGEHFKTVRRFVRQTGYVGLVPAEMPKGFRVEDVLVYYDSMQDCPIVTFVSNDPLHVTVGVNIGKEVVDLETRERMERIGSYNCGLSFSNQQCHCEFNYDGNEYFVDAKTYEDVVCIVKNMKGILEK